MGGKPLLFHHIKEQFGVRWRFYHRVDVHNCLKELATDPQAGPGIPVKITLDSQVMAIGPEEGTLKLKDGQTIRKNLIVVADGQHVR